MHAEHRTILVVDIESFGDQHRTGPHQVAARTGLYQALEHAFAASSIPWPDCHHEDRGDGVLVLVPPHVPKALLTESLPGHLANALREHNALHSLPARIRLRMALHAGEMHLDRHGVTGRSVNLAFRLLEASELKSALARSSGLVALIVSSWFFDEVVKDSPASNPTAYRKVQVTVKETSTDAWIFIPELRSIPITPRQLPVAPELVGRATELSRLTALAPGARVVISGAAGIGKTALALRWANQVADRFSDGHLYVDLNGFGYQQRMAADEALYGFLVSLGVDPGAIPATQAARAAVFRSLLADRNMLVVLDNAADSDHVLPLLPGAFPGVVIITSRSRLDGLATRVDVEHLPLDLLDADEGLELLVHRLGRSRVDAEPEAAATLVRLCAGLPLALSIVAARTRLGLRRLVAELANERTPLAALAVDDAGLDLRSFFSWSYQRLASLPAKLFRLFGLHPGEDIDVYAAAALAEAGLSDTRRAIDSLLGAHLLEERFPGRFSMHDLLRAYALELADADGDDPLARLSGYYLSTADRADRFITPHRFRIPLDIGTVAAAPPIDDYHQALDWFSAEHGNLLGICRSSVGSSSWQLAYTLRGFFFLTKRWDAWIETHERALAACMHLGDLQAEATTRNNLGRALLESGRQKEAAGQYESARRLFEKIGDRHGLSNALANQATIMRREGRLDEALTNVNQALAYYRHVGARRNKAITLRTMSLIELGLGRLDDASNHIDEALHAFRALGNDLEAAKGFNTLGLIMQLRGALTAAEDAYRQAIQISRQCGSRYEEARARHRLGAICAVRGARDDAKREWTQSLSLYQALGAVKAGRVAADLSSLATRPLQVRGHTASACGAISHGRPSEQTVAMRYAPVCLLTAETSTSATRIYHAGNACQEELRRLFIAAEVVARELTEGVGKTSLAYAYAWIVRFHDPCTPVPRDERHQPN
jgi:tetratricopeptide (TPR) repeat protein